MLISRILNIRPNQRHFILLDSWKDTDPWHLSISRIKEYFWLGRMNYQIKFEIVELVIGCWISWKTHMCRTNIDKGVWLSYISAMLIIYIILLSYGLCTLCKYRCATSVTSMALNWNRAIGSVLSELRLSFLQQWGWTPATL